MANVLKVLGDGLGNRYLTDGHAKRLHQFQGVIMRAVGGAETGHRDADDTLAVEGELVESLHGDEQGECRVESAADADDGLLGIDMIEPLGESSHLYVQNLLTRAGHILALGDEGVRVDIPE